MFVLLNYNQYRIKFSVLEEEDITPRHCHMNFADGKVSLLVEDGMCSVNGRHIEDKHILSHGEYCQFPFNLKVRAT